MHVDNSICLHCGACVGTCPENCLFLHETSTIEWLDGCTLCGLCEKVCPVGAITFGDSGTAEVGSQLSVPLRARSGAASRIETDVLVVGAGPAGSMAARFAARSGLRTLLIEKRQEIGSPVRCGEGTATTWMEECEITQDPAWVSSKVHAQRIFSPDGSCAVIGGDRPGNEVRIVLERHLFDKALAHSAAEAGAGVMLKTHATGLTRHNGTMLVAGKSLGREIEISAKVVIGADGFESQVGRWVGIDTTLDPTDIFATIQYRLCNIDCDTRYWDFHLGSCAPGGYIWVFPKAHGVANVGIGVQLSGILGRAEAREYLDRWIAGQPGLAGGQTLDIVSGGVSTNKPPERTVSDGVMLVGDAARLIDPLTGGGIRNACISGKLAGQTAVEAVEKGDTSERFLARYEKAWRARLGKKLKRNWMAKERGYTLDNEALNSVVKTLSEVDTDSTTLSLLMAVGKKHPKLVAGFAKLIF